MNFKKSLISMKIKLIYILLGAVITLQGQIAIEENIIFPLQNQHVHSSSIVELSNGDLLACWFQGSGERKANDVVINGARLRKGDLHWSKPFLMADTPDFPDCNPVLFLNKQNKLFLVWIVVQANRWESSILKYKTSINYENSLEPEWNWQDIILIKPDNKFAEEVKTKFKNNKGPERVWAEYAPEYEKMISDAAKDPVKRETGWMTRIKPLIKKKGQILLPLYSDGFNISLIVFSNDDGTNWNCSLPIVGKGNIQPSLIEKDDGTLVAFMRDNGDEPGRVLVSQSSDNGNTWSFAKKSNIPNPGASIATVELENGNWILVYNDAENGRHNLTIALSNNEGKTWNWKRTLENSNKGKGSFAYPTVIQSKDGKIHISYSYHLGKERRTIKHVSFLEEWIKK